jgi:hypothetical protein
MPSRMCEFVLCFSMKPEERGSVKEYPNSTCVEEHIKIYFTWKAQPVIGPLLIERRERSLQVCLLVGVHQICLDCVKRMSIRYINGLGLRAGLHALA